MGTRPPVAPRRRVERRGGGGKAEDSEELPTKRRSQASAAGAVPDDTERYAFGFDNETQLAWRALLGKRHMRKECSLPLKLESHVQDHEFARAVWPDGMTKEVSGVTAGALRLMLSGRQAKDLGLLWTSEHARSHHMINVSQKTDRALLIFISEQSRQVCACRVDTFGELTDAEQFILLAHDHPVLKTAAKFMISLATDYSKDLLELDRLKGERDDRLRAARLGGRRKAYPKKEAEVGETVLKRPAAKQFHEKEVGGGSAEFQPLAPMPKSPGRSASRMAPSETEPLSTTMDKTARASSGFKGAEFPPFIDEDWDFGV